MICTSKVLAHQTLRCPVCENQKSISPSYAGYSVRFDCCKSWVVTGAFELPTMEKDNFMVMPPIKLTWTEIKKPVRTPRYGSDPMSWTVRFVAGGFRIEDEYGELLDGCWYDIKHAWAALKAAQAEEAEAREQHGPEDGNPHTLPVE